MNELTPEQLLAQHTKQVHTVTAEESKPYIPPSPDALKPIPPTGAGILETILGEIQKINGKLDLLLAQKIVTSQTTTLEPPRGSALDEWGDSSAGE